MPSKTCPSCRASYSADLEICPRDGSALEDEAEWLPGTIIGGKYAILRRLSEDEVSSRYEARVLNSGESRTLQVLRAEFNADASAVREFRRVGRLLQKIAQPNVLRVEAADEAEDGRPFLVTEFTEAPSLAELLRDGKPIEAKRACAVARGIAAALEACHRLDLLHLSLEPGNILLTGPPEDEQVKVQGFGTGLVWAARSRDGHRSGKTALRELMPAALAYSSPEQGLGRSPEMLDARSDLYSLGVLLYRMLTGRLPFRSAADGEDGLAPLAARLEAAAADVPAEGNGSGLPEPLAELVMQLLERRPELRPATARAVIDRIGLAEGRIGAPATLPLEFPAPEVEPAAAQALEEFPIPAAPPLPGQDLEPISVPPAPPQTVIGLDAVVLDSTAPGIAAPPSGPAAAPETAEAPAAAVEAACGAGTSGWANSHSILFQAEPPARAARRSRWVWAAVAVLVLAAAGWFFVRRGGLRWNGPGPLSPFSSDQIRRMLRGGTTQPETPATPASTPGAGQQPSANPVQGAQNPPSESGPAAPPAGNPPASPASNAGQKEAAGAGSAPPALPPASSTTAGEASRSGTPAQKPKAGSAREEIMAEVNRAVAAGDVFFELGQYDLAVRAYEGPLKLDPNNKLLHSRIDRALKAKAAEQQFLGQ
jgi:eukaryotic-like serine/threonine-protein kinase